MLCGRICASVCRRSRGPVARQEVGATPIAKAIAAVLAVKSGSPGLLIKREYLSEAERIFEMTRSIYPAGQFRYRSELHLDRRA